MAQIVICDRCRQEFFVDEERAQDARCLSCGCYFFSAKRDKGEAESNGSRALRDPTVKIKAHRCALCSGAIDEQGRKRKTFILANWVYRADGWGGPGIARVVRRLVERAEIICCAECVRTAVKRKMLAVAEKRDRHEEKQRRAEARERAFKQFDQTVMRHQIKFFAAASLCLAGVWIGGGVGPGAHPAFYVLFGIGLLLLLLPSLVWAHKLETRIKGLNVKPTQGPDEGTVNADAVREAVRACLQEGAGKEMARRHPEVVGTQHFLGDEKEWQEILDAQADMA